MINSVLNSFDNINFYSKDKNGVYLFVNPAMVECFQVDSANDLIGKTSHELPGAEYADGLQQNDLKIIKTKKSTIFVEKASFQGQPQLYRSFKSPLLGRHGAALGIFGVSLPIQNTSLIPLTPQQTACLKELALGFTHKEIAKNLGLSPKTVEHYLGNVKCKLNCQSRAELILQAIERGLVNPF
jgi:DNA-binding CsgD family transcriptional regulator